VSELLALGDGIDSSKNDQRMGIEDFLITNFYSLARVANRGWRVGQQKGYFLHGLLHVPPYLSSQQKSTNEEKTSDD